MKITHYERVLQHLKKYGSITSWEAIKEYGYTRLSDAIFKIRKAGYVVENENITTKNRFGDSVTFAKYKLVV